MSVFTRNTERAFSGLDRRFAGPLQGYLAHKKQPHSRNNPTLPERKRTAAELIERDEHVPPLHHMRPRLPHLM